MKNSTPPKNRRRHYFINRRFQTKFIIKFCMIVVLGSLLTAVLIYWMARHSTTVAIVEGKIAVHTTAEYLLPLLVQTIVVELIVVSLAVAWMTLFISHKIAGPLYHFQLSLKALGQGDLTPVQLRHLDQLQEIANSYNEAVQSLDDKVRAMKQASTLDEVKRILDTFKA